MCKRLRPSHCVCYVRTVCVLCCVMLHNNTLSDNTTTRSPRTRHIFYYMLLPFIMHGYFTRRRRPRSLGAPQCAGICVVVGAKQKIHTHSRVERKWSSYAKSHHRRRRQYFSPASLCHTIAHIAAACIRRTSSSLSSHDKWATCASAPPNCARLCVAHDATTEQHEH